MNGEQPHDRPNRPHHPYHRLHQLRGYPVGCCVLGAVMSPEAFSSWVYHMQVIHGWNKRECSEHLGCGLNQVARWSRTGSRGAPRYIALACMALSLGMPPWTYGEAPRQEVA